MVDADPAQPKPRRRREPRLLFKVYVTSQQAREITALAKLTALPVSTYLRERALGFQPKSVFDREGMDAFIKAAGDLERLGGLLKQALSRGEGVPDVRQLALDLRSAQQHVVDAIKHVYARR